MIYNRSITATVYVIHKSKVLLHLHKKYNTWFPLGGHIEPDEFPHEAALREVREESGLHVRLLTTEVAPEIALGKVDRVPAPFCLCHEGIGHEEEFLDFIFIGISDSDEPCPQNGESKTFRWFSKEDLLAHEIKPHVKNTALAALAHYEEVMKAQEQNAYSLRRYTSLPDSAKEIRVTVFVEEQGFVEEFDEIDSRAVHFVLYDKDTAIATCRVFKADAGNDYFLGRLAVKKEYRGKRIGSRLIEAAEAYVREADGDALCLHAQCAAKKFYEKSGFSAYGGIEYEQDCPHVWMKKAVK